MCERVSGVEGWGRLRGLGERGWECKRAEWGARVGEDEGEIDSFGGGGIRNRNRVSERERGLEGDDNMYSTHKIDHRVEQKGVRMTSSECQ